MLRNYGTENGNLYKPESMGVGGGVDGKDGDGWQMGEKPDGEDFPQKGEIPDGEDFPQKREMPDGEDFPQKGDMQMERTFRRMMRCRWRGLSANGRSSQWRGSRYQNGNHGWKWRLRSELYR